MHKMAECNILIIQRLERDFGSLSQRLDNPRDIQTQAILATIGNSGVRTAIEKAAGWFPGHKILVPSDPMD